MKPSRLAAYGVALFLSLAGSGIAYGSHSGRQGEPVEVMETIGVARAVYKLDCLEEKPANVDYRTVDETAVAGRDYRHVSGRVTVSRNNPAYLEVPILDDHIPESVETFRINLVVDGVPFPGEVGFGGCHTAAGGWGTPWIEVKILDDDDLSGSGQAAAAPEQSSAAAPGQSSGGSPSLLAEGLSASGPRVIADTTETGEAQGLASRSAAQHESSPSYPAPLIALGAALLIMGAALSAYLRRRLRSQL